MTHHRRSLKVCLSPPFSKDCYLGILNVPQRFGDFGRPWKDSSRSVPSIPGDVGATKELPKRLKSEERWGSESRFFFRKYRENIAYSFDKKKKSMKIRMITTANIIFNILFKWFGERTIKFRSWLTRKECSKYPTIWKKSHKLFRKNFQFRLYTEETRTVPIWKGFLVTPHRCKYETLIVSISESKRSLFLSSFSIQVFKTRRRE